MGFRSRVGDTLVRVGKTFGTSVPESFRQGEEQSQMTPASPFSPGTPIGPYDGYDRHPRAFNFQTAYNIATRPRTNEAVSFGTLQGLIQSYDVADICIWHRIDSIRSLDWKLLPADHVQSDVTDAIPLGLAALRKPDRINSFKTWLAKFLYDVLAYDAGSLYRLRNRGGRCVGLSVVDGTTIAPLLDYWGNPPQEPAEAFVQYVNGLPWNWLTRADMIYEPFRPRPNSPYGHAPIESVILNANTDLRFQVYFLQRFTTGNLPAAFAASPESWSPEQIEQFQTYWDAMMLGDQSEKHQVKWMPPGSKFEWSDEKDFSDVFSLFLMRKTCASFHVVPSDLGFTENVNRSSGESQADVQHRVGDLPLMEHVEGILSQFLLDDLGLPLRFEWDRGEEQVDQAAQAEADQRYMDRAVVSPSEIREMRYGLTDAKPVARVFFTERAGPIPLNSVLALAGAIDPQTAAPAEGADLPHQVFTETPGVQPNPPLYSQPLAAEIYGPSAIPPHTETSSTLPVAKEGEGAGITAETGVYSYDLERDDEEPDEAEQVRKELAAFHRFERRHRKAETWRDFEFHYVSPLAGQMLNELGRRAVRKDAGGTPGLTSRSGMISLDLPPGIVAPPPGGVTDQHVTVVYLGPDVDDDVFAAACSRAAAAAAMVPGPLTASLSGVSSFPPSDGSDGKVPAFVPVAIPGAEVLREALEDLSASEHKDWHPHVTLAYLEPGEPLPDPCEPVTAVLTHLSVHRGGDVMRYPLGPIPDCCGGECCQGGCCGGASGCGCGPAAVDEGAVAKAGGSSATPKFRPPTLDLPNLTGVWAEVYDRRGKLLRKHLKAVAAAWDACMAELGSPLPVVRQFRAEAGKVAKLADPHKAWWKDAGTAAALAWLLRLEHTKGWPALVAALEDAIRSGMAEGEADALALAADRQGKTGFAIERAFRAAYERLAGDAKVARQAQDAAGKITDGAAGDAGRALADQAGDDGSEQDMADAVDGVLSGDGSQSVGLGVDWWLWLGIGAGALAFYQRMGTGAGGGNAADVASLAWVTAGDSRVCPVPCQENEDNSPYTISSAPTMPGHARCRCSWDTTATVASSWLDDFLN